MNPNGTLLPLVDRIRGRAFILGLAGALAMVAIAIINRDYFHAYFGRAYLFAFVFWMGISLGSMALLMLHRQLGGAWGFLIRRPLEAGAMTIPLMLALFVPILFDLERIYPWARHEEAANPEGGRPATETRLKSSDLRVGKGSPVRVTGRGASVGASGTRRDPLEEMSAEGFDFKGWWLDPVHFTVRVAIYFTTWIVMAMVLVIGSRRQDTTGSTRLAYGLQSFSAPGLVVYFLTVSFAFIDWGMSLESDWYSSIYGVLIMIGQAVSTMAFMICVAAIIAGRGEVEGLDKPETFNDLGNLLLTFVMLWAYISFSQFLIIWAGNLTEEIPWYLRRLHGGYQNIGRFLMLFHFTVPFLILLARPLKRNISSLWKIAAMVLVAHLVDAYWLIVPSFGPTPSRQHPLLLSPSWLDLAAPVAIGGLWVTAFTWFLKTRPLMIAHDPELLPALKQAAGAH